MRHVLVISSLLTLLLAPTGCDRCSSEAASEPRTAEAVAETVAEPTAPAPEPEGPANPLGLPDDLSLALRREMLSLEPAMAGLQSHIAHGRREQAAATATQILDSFILKQELGEAQMQTLVSSLPEGFLRRDRAFHQQAAGLARAALAGDMAEAAQRYGAMASSCVGCHAEFASSRFPGLEGVSVPLPEAASGDEAAEHVH